MLVAPHRVLASLCLVTLVQTNVPTPDVINVIFDASSHGHVVDKEFLSFSQDGAIFVNHWHDFNARSGIHICI